MDVYPATIFVALGTVTAALIAGAFSYFNLVASKESKVSEFRQAWIDALRADIAVYVARMQVISAILHANEKEKVDGKEDLKLKVYEQYGEAKVAHSAIHLRINKNEKDTEAKVINDEFISALEKAHACYQDKKFEEINCRLDNVIRAASALLKMEWNRVRDGEPGYQKSKKYAVRLSIAALVIASILVVALLANQGSCGPCAATLKKEFVPGPHNNPVKADGPVGPRP